MKAFLMYPDRDFDLERDLPPNEADLDNDLELGVLLRAMASGDKFLFEVARHGLHSGLASPAWSGISTTWRSPRLPGRGISSAGQSGIRRNPSCTAPGS
jgi:hypothetical protein